MGAPSWAAAARPTERARQCPGLGCESDFIKVGLGATWNLTVEWKARQPLRLPPASGAPCPPLLPLLRACREPRAPASLQPPRQPWPFFSWVPPPGLPCPACSPLRLRASLPGLEQSCPWGPCPKAAGSADAGRRAAGLWVPSSPVGLPAPALGLSFCSPQSFTPPLPVRLLPWSAQEVGSGSSCPRLISLSFLVLFLSRLLAEDP